MATRRAPLRAVTEDEKPPEKVRPKSISEAAASGSHIELLTAMRARIAKTVEDPNCPPRDLAALTRRLQEIAREIEAINAGEDDDIGSAAATPDAAWDGAAI